MKITFSSVFETDFAEIVTHLASSASPEVALRFENRALEAVELIGRSPEIGRRRKELAPGNLRSLRVSGFDSYLIFYQVRVEDIFFVRVLHGAMDLPAMFS